jgi:hypothetical protein
VPVVAPSPSSSSSSSSSAAASYARTPHPCAISAASQVTHVTEDVFPMVVHRKNIAGLHRPVQNRIMDPARFIWAVACRFVMTTHCRKRTKTASAAGHELSFWDTIQNRPGSNKKPMIMRPAALAKSGKLEAHRPVQDAQTTQKTIQLARTNKTTRNLSSPSRASEVSQKCGKATLKSQQPCLPSGHNRAERPMSFSNLSMLISKASF